MASAYRDAVVGPGPHYVEHGLGVSRPCVVVMDDQYGAIPCAIEHVDANTSKIEVGYLSVPEGEWVMGCRPDAIIHVLIVR